MDPRIENLSLHGSSEGRRSAVGSPRNSPFSRGTGTTSNKLGLSIKKSGFGGAFEEYKSTRQTKNEELAHSWNGRSIYEMNNPNNPNIDKEKGDQAFILFNQLPPDVRVLSMACTQQNTFVLSVQGKVYSWGVLNETLGRYTSSKLEAKKPDRITDLNEIVQIVAGHDHVLALDLQGCVYAWGSNQFGQLGLGQQTLASETPVFVEALQDSVAQIFAGPNCSFAVTKQGQLYSWGQNSYSQLGQMGPTVFSPKPVPIAPWSKEEEISIVTGKSYLGYVYSTFSASKSRQTKVVNNADMKRMELKVKELEENIKSMAQLNQQLSENLVGARPNPKLMKNFEEDQIIRQLKEDEKTTHEEKKITQQKIHYLDDEIRGLENDLKILKNQLVDIETRENDLLDEVQRYENDLSKRERNDRGTRDLERQKKGKEDLLKANEQIKNVVQQKQNEREEKRLDLTAELDSLVKKLKKLESRSEMLSSVIAERKATIAQGAFLENKNYILILIKKLYTIFSDAKEATIEDVMRHMEGDKGLLEALYESNDQLIKFKKDVDILKVNPNDPLHDIVSKLLEMFQDNISTRIKMNDYSYTILLHLDKKLNDLHQTHKKKMNFDIRQTWTKESNVSSYKQKYNADIRMSQIPMTTSSVVKKSP